jgi:hypothetical protein
MVGRECARWLKDHGGKIEIITTRNYLPLKTAFYAEWLVFHDRSIAESFLSAWPRYDAQKQFEILRSQRGSLKEKTEQRLKSGKYDLSCLAEQDRLPVARRYVELTEKLNHLDQHIKDIELAQTFGVGWTKQISTQ